ncbi:hypothetical protein PVAND_013685 [Polypedilum vanderplanki]|uniref:Uncharacterized protein n=1 Tax=Polypedilum vanderplanki TaxID=319348 RepID=A0A9J6CSB8_POLVA|nr:hypothetical protein PVAND_013685 [Polypedilum vanderplanki]
MSNFTRPVNLKFPQIYGTFKAFNKTGDAEIEYQIRDLPEELFEKSLEILASDFVPEETICVGQNLMKKPAALNEICYIWYETMKDGLSLGCFANDGSNELAGVAVMKVLTKDKEPIEELQV